MGDRSLVINVIDSLIDSDPNVSNAAFEAGLTQTASARAVNINVNTNAANIYLATVSPTAYSNSVAVTGFELLSNVNVNSSLSNFVVINLWKRESGTKTVIASINTGNVATNVVSFNTVSANVANVALVARNAVLGYDTTTTGTGLGDNTSMLTLNLKGQ